MISVLLFITSILLPGLALSWLLSPRYIRAGRALVISFGVGAALLTLELFLYFVVLRAPFSSVVYWFFSIQALLSAAYLIFRIWKNRERTFVFPKIDSLQWLLGGLIALVMLGSLIQAVSKPPVAYDAVAFWSLRAKILQNEGRVNFNPESQTFLSTYSHRNYPWHVSLLDYWFRQVGGSDSSINIISWLYFFSCTLVLIDVMIRRWRTGGLFLTLLFCTQPLIFYHGSNNYADLILGFYAAAGFAFLLDWLRKQRLSDLMLAAACIGFTVTVKNYGIFYIIALAVALGLALAYKRLSWRPLLKTVAALLIPLLPLALFKIFFNLNLRNSEASSGWHPEVLRPIVDALFSFSSWNIWWAAFVCMAILLIPVIRRYRELTIAWIFFATAFAVLIAVFFVTENFQWALDHTALSRGMIPLIPLSLLLIDFSFTYATDSYPQR